MAELPLVSPPNPRHQRRILVRANVLLSRGRRSALFAACTNWQDAYIGGLYVLVRGELFPVGAVNVVRRLLAWGLSAQSVTFFDPHAIAGIAELRETVLRPAGTAQAHVRAVAEVLAIGATDIAAPEPGLLRACRETAWILNRALRAPELPAPAEAPTPPEVPTVCQIAACPDRRNLARLLLAEGRRQVSRNCDQILDLLDQAGGMPGHSQTEHSGGLT